MLNTLISSLHVSGIQVHKSMWMYVREKERTILPTAIFSSGPYKERPSQSCSNTQSEKKRKRRKLKFDLLLSPHFIYISQTADWGWKRVLLPPSSMVTKYYLCMACLPHCRCCYGNQRISRLGQVGLSRS